MTRQFSKEVFIKKFWEKINIGGSDECWKWRKNSGGYARVRRNGTSEAAHRVAYSISFGEIPFGMNILHKCDNPPCCNPAHLLLGTHKDNMQDKAKKGRSNIPSGENHGNAKLTYENVADIRSKYASGSYLQKELARIFGVSQVTICRIVRGEQWS